MSKMLLKPLFQSVLSVILTMRQLQLLILKKTTIDEYYRQIGAKYFPDKTYKNVTLPFCFGKLIGFISTTVSNLFKMKEPLLDSTFYAVYHVSSNLDFPSEKMEKAIHLLDERLITK